MQVLMALLLTSLRTSMDCSDSESHSSCTVAQVENSASEHLDFRLDFDQMCENWPPMPLIHKHNLRYQNVMPDPNQCTVNAKTEWE
jgi:hypothetical protein